VEGINKVKKWSLVMKIIRTSVSQKRLRELAKRVLRVIERHKSDAGVKTAAESLIPVAWAYAKAYDELVRYQSNQGSEMQEGREGIEELGCALEMLHTYSLVHDDLPCMDDDDWRRGRQTTHRLFDAPMAALVGFLLVPVAVEEE